MIYPILLYGHKALHQKSNPIDLKSASKKEVQGMLDDMFETMHRAGGIGLAAIQIGVLARAFVVEAHLEDEDYHFRESFINPVIKSTSNKTVYLTEGCLSLPGLSCLVERPESIEIEYYNYDLKKVKKKYDGISARIIQHEFDHLNGVLYTDNLETMWKTMLEPGMDKIKERKVKPNYPST